MYLTWFYILKAKVYWEGFLTSACYNLTTILENCFLLSDGATLPILSVMVEFN